jgi:Transglutaminase-like superfamily
MVKDRPGIKYGQAAPANLIYEPCARLRAGIKEIEVPAGWRKRQCMKFLSSVRLVWTGSRIRVWEGLLLAIFFGTAYPASAQCDLQIASAGPCLADGTYGTPAVGDDYFLRVDANVIGTPAHPFRIKWTLANVTYYFDNISVGPGNGYWWYIDYSLPLDDSMPWSVTLDPDGVSGDTNLANNTISGTFTPTPPTNAVELYDPRILGGSETSILNYQPGSGSLDNLWVLFGDPTTHGAQQVINVTEPANAVLVVTAPYGLPIFDLARTNVVPATFQDTESFTAQLSRMRVNPDLLREVTWADMAGMSSNWTQWLAPDQICESTDPAISNFVQQALPADYRTTMTPYDTARQLHMAVMQALSYQDPPDYYDAVNVLAEGRGDCGGYSALLTAALRQVGIPARRIAGFWIGDSWSGDSQTHIRVEFHLPGIEWLVADPTIGDDYDPTGTYAYEFGYLPDADSFFAVDVGDAHEMPFNNFAFLQVPNYWWYGSATLNDASQQYYLQPVCSLCAANRSGSTFQFTVTNAPDDGSIVIETSSNLFNWLPVLTNAASADSNYLNCSFPAVNGTAQYFRVNQLP